MGGAIHADDLRITAASSDSVSSQDKVIKCGHVCACAEAETLQTYIYIYPSREPSAQS